MDCGSSSASPGVPDDLIQRLQRKVGNLQMLPAVAMQALEYAKDPDCDLKRLSSVIERDLKLTTFILRMANSALFSTGAPVASLHQAVARLGLRHCRAFILTSSLDSLQKKLTAELQSVRLLLWRHSFLTGIFAVQINRLLELGFEGEDFTAGLMHDLGRTLFAVAVPEQFRMIDPLDFNEPADIETRERAAIGTSHAEFGEWFATINELPEPLVIAIRHHHNPEAAGPYLRLTAVTAAADHMANHVQRDDGHRYQPASNSAVSVLETSGVASATKRFTASSNDFLQECPAIAEALMRA